MCQCGVPFLLHGCLRLSVLRSHLFWSRCRTRCARFHKFLQHPCSWRTLPAFNSAYVCVFVVATRPERVCLDLVGTMTTSSPATTPDPSTSSLWNTQFEHTLDSMLALRMTSSSSSCHADDGLVPSISFITYPQTRWPCRLGLPLAHRSMCLAWLV